MEVLVEHRKHLAVIGIVGSMIACIGFILQLIAMSGVIPTWEFDVYLIGIIIIASSLLIGIGCISQWNLTLRPIVVLAIVTYFASSIVGIYWTLTYTGEASAQFMYIWRIQATLSVYSFTFLMLSHLLKQRVKPDTDNDFVEPLAYALFFLFFVSSYSLNFLLPSYFLTIALPLNFFTIIFLRDIYQTADFY